MITIEEAPVLEGLQNKPGRAESHGPAIREVERSYLDESLEVIVKKLSKSADPALFVRRVRPIDIDEISEIDESP